MQVRVLGNKAFTGIPTEKNGKESAGFRGDADSETRVTEPGRATQKRRYSLWGQRLFLFVRGGELEKQQVAEKHHNSVDHGYLLIVVGYGGQAKERK